MKMELSNIEKQVQPKQTMALCTKRMLRPVDMGMGMQAREVVKLPYEAWRNEPRAASRDSINQTAERLGHILYIRDSDTDADSDEDPDDDLDI